jgi:hypothetical protein
MIMPKPTRRIRMTYEESINTTLEAEDREVRKLERSYHAKIAARRRKRQEKKHSSKG